MVHATSPKRYVLASSPLALPRPEHTMTGWIVSGRGGRWAGVRREGVGGADNLAKVVMDEGLLVHAPKH